MKPRQMKRLLIGDAKDKLPADEEPGVVYAIGCKTCPSVYIGETARTTRQRVKEHETHTRHGNTQLSALASQAHGYAHDIHWRAHIIAREDNTEKRNVKEALAIKRLATQRGSEVTMNQDTGKSVGKLWLDLA